MAQRRIFLKIDDPARVRGILNVRHHGPERSSVEESRG